MTLDVAGPCAAFGAQVRSTLDTGRPSEFRGGVLPPLLRALTGNTAADHAWRDRRTTVELLTAMAAGDRSAEAPVYVRAAPELDRVAARAVGSSALDREDLHQEGAVRLITDGRGGKILSDFGGVLGAYLHRAVLAHCRNIAATTSPGRPNDPTRLTQRLRQALRATASADGAYDLVAAAVFARERHGWTLATFWDVHTIMFGSTTNLHTPDRDGRTLADTLTDTDTATALDRVENIEAVRALMSADVLAPREREVVRVLFGLDGPVLSEPDAARVLGVTRQSINKTKRAALAKLGALLNT